MSQQPSEEQSFESEGSRTNREPVAGEDDVLVLIPLWRRRSEPTEPAPPDRPLPAIGAFDFSDLPDNVSERVEELVYGLVPD